MKVKLIKSEENTIQLVQAEFPFRVIFTKNINDLRYPAPQVYLEGIDEIMEVCPDSGRVIKIEIQ